MSRQIAIGTKLLASVGTLLGMLAILAGGALYSVSRLQDRLDQAGATGKRTDIAGEMDALLGNMRTAARGMIVYTALNDQAQVSAEAQKFDKRAAEFGDTIRQIKPMLVVERGRRAVGQMETALPALVQATHAFGELCKQGKTNDAIVSMRTYGTPPAETLDKSIDELKEVQRRQFREAMEAGGQQAAFARWMTWALMVLALGAGAVAVWIVVGLSRRLRHATLSLDEGITQINSASSQVATSSQTLARGAAQQAAALEETSASAEEITSMTRRNAESSRAAAEVMTTVHRTVGDGNQALEQLTGSMAQINASSDKIAKIIKVIDEIAFQTNILALNAAVEAARAGEAGMGFAVVADEVRNLAQRSAQASKDTAALIEESIASSRDGHERVEHVNGAIRAITTSAEEVKTLVDTVSSGSDEQTRGIEQIAKAVSHMDQTTQATAATAEESAAAAEQLSAQAESMSRAVRELRVLVDGGEVAA